MTFTDDETRLLRRLLREHANDTSSNTTADMAESILRKLDGKAETEVTYVVVQGDPFDGLCLSGPFANAEDARAWAASLKGTWWIASVFPPNYGG